MSSFLAEAIVNMNQGINTIKPNQKMIDFSTREKSIYTAQTVNDIGRSSITFFQIF